MDSEVKNFALHLFFIIETGRQSRFVGCSAYALSHLRYGKFIVSGIMYDYGQSSPSGFFSGYSFRNFAMRH
jgi:hypothetical protein